MTTLFSYDFEGADGTAMTAANTGLNFVQSGWTFSSAHVMATIGGSTCGKVVSTGSSVVANGLTAWASAGVVYYRFYLYVETMPTATITVFNIRSGTDAIGAVRLSDTGAISINNGNGVQIATSPDGRVSAGTQLRIGGKVDAAGALQQVKVFVGANANGSTADYDSGSITSVTGGPITSTGWQAGVINATSATFHFDNLAVSDAGFIGPIVAASPPTCNAGPDQANVEPYSTVTLTGSDTTSAGSLTRAWTQTAGTTVQSFTGTSSQVATVKVAGTVTGETLTFSYHVSDVNGSATDTVNVTVLPVTELALVGGSWVPLELRAL